MALIVTKKYKTCRATQRVVNKCDTLMKIHKAKRKEKTSQVTNN
jgi:hypothetical protein